MCPQLENPLEVVTNTLREQIQYKPEETGRSAQYYKAMIRQVIKYHYNCTRIWSKHFKTQT